MCIRDRLQSATRHQLSFLSHPKYQNQLADTLAGCVIVTAQFEQVAAARGACIVTDQPYLYYARVTQLWKKSLPSCAAARIHPSAAVSYTHLDVYKRQGQYQVELISL